MRILGRPKGRQNLLTRFSCIIQFIQRAISCMCLLLHPVALTCVSLNYVCPIVCLCIVRMWPTSNVVPFVCRFYSETGQVRGTKWWVLSRSSLLCCRFDVIVYFFHWLFSFSSSHAAITHGTPHTQKGTEILTHHADAGLIRFYFQAEIKTKRNFFFLFFF